MSKKNIYCFDLHVVNGKIRSVYFGFNNEKRAFTA